MLMSIHYRSETAFSETPQEKYEYVIFLQPKYSKMCHKNFDDRLSYKILMPKIILNRPFACAREVIQTS